LTAAHRSWPNGCGNVYNCRCAHQVGSNTVDPCFSFSLSLLLFFFFSLSLSTTAAAAAGNSNPTLVLPSLKPGFVLNSFAI
jgi:hypothetical protein